MDDFDIDEITEMMIKGTFYLLFDGESLREAIQSYARKGPSRYVGHHSKEAAIEEALCATQGAKYWIYDSYAQIVAVGIVP